MRQRLGGLDAPLALEGLGETHEEGGARRELGLVDVAIGDELDEAVGGEPAGEGGGEARGSKGTSEVWYTRAPAPRGRPQALNSLRPWCTYFTWREALKRRAKEREAVTDVRRG